MENKTYQSASKYVEEMIDLYGPKYSNIHKAILDNCVNSEYVRYSNDFVTYVWQVLNKKYEN